MEADTTKIDRDLRGIPAFHSKHHATENVRLSAAFVNSYLFAGLFENSMILKLPAESRMELLKFPGAACVEPVPGRTMGEFVVVPPSFTKNPARLKPWLESAYAYVKSFPPKTRKKRTASDR